MLSWLSGLPQRFCAAKALWDNFRAPAKIAWRVLWEEERQAYQVMRQTKRAADQNALPRRGGALTAFELGNAPLFGAFPDRARALPRETVPSEARREGCKGRIYASKTTLPSGSFLACHLPLHSGGS